MAIVVETTHALLLDQQQWITDSIKGSGYQCLPTLFLTGKHGCAPLTSNSADYSQPPLPSSQDSTTNVNSGTKKGKTKRKLELNHGEIQLHEYHQKHGPFIESRGKELLTASEGYFERLRKTLLHSLNRQIPLQLDMPPSASQLQPQGDYKGKEKIILHEGTNSIENINDCFVENPTNCTCVVKTHNSVFLIPAFSSFLNVDFTSVRRLLCLQRKFDAVIIDPPWENKSAKRRKGYSSLPEQDLKKIPLKPITSMECLLFVWVTNKQKYVTFVEERLLGVWGFELVGHWHWLKVSAEGEPVRDFSSVHKKPYEVLLVAKKKGSTLDIPPNKVVCSVPSVVHSQKPCLKEIVDQYVGEHAHCLELFARNLVPGWTSWGDEVLKFQNIEYYEQISNLK